MSATAHTPPFDAALAARVRAIAIDLDGTLLDTIDDLAAAVNLMLAKLRLPALPQARVKAMVGKGMANLVKKSLAAASGEEPTATQAQAALALYEECYAALLGRDTRLYPGVRAALEAFASARLPLACVTNKTARFTLPLLEQQGLRHYFNLVVCGDTLPRRKPDPMPLLHTAQHFGVPPEALLMLGDSINDAEAARAAGALMIGVPYGYNEGVPLRHDDCDGMVPDLSAVAALLGLDERQQLQPAARRVAEQQG